MIFPRLFVKTTIPLRQHLALAYVLTAAVLVTVLLTSSSRAAGEISQPVSPQPPRLHLAMDPAQTKISFTLGATAHTVHGHFSLTKGDLSFDPASGRIEGEIVIDSRSGNTDNDGRDAKMHKDVLESTSFREIIFRPDHAEGFSAAAGALSGTVHGEFVIHGNRHEMSVPVSVQFAQDRWNASAKFTVPYVDWGLRNPSTFLLRVSKTVDIDVETSGSLKNPAASD